MVGSDTGRTGSETATRLIRRPCKMAIFSSAVHCWHVLLTENVQFRRLPCGCADLLFICNVKISSECEVLQKRQDADIFLKLICH
jgi:hypothetical protein